MGNNHTPNSSYTTKTVPLRQVKGKQGLQHLQHLLPVALLHLTEHDASDNDEKTADVANRSRPLFQNGKHIVSHETSTLSLKSRSGFMESN